MSDQNQQQQQEPRTPMQIIEDFLRHGCEVYKEYPDSYYEGAHYTDPYKSAFSDALYLWGNGNNPTPAELVAALRKNKKRVQQATDAYPNREWRTRVGKQYKDIATWIENVIRDEPIDPIIEQEMQQASERIIAIQVIMGSGKPGLIKYITLTYTNASQETFFMMEGNHVYRWLLQNKPEIIAAWRERTLITSF